MKLNFWQWLGIAIFVIGGIGLFVYEKEKPAAPALPPATQPAP